MEEKEIRQRKIIVALNDVDFAQETARNLVNRGYTVEIVTPDTKVITNVITEVNPDIVICPAVMPEGGALYLIDNVHTTFIFVGAPDKLVENLILRSETATYIELPIAPLALAKVVDRLSMFVDVNDEHLLEQKVTQLLRNIGVPANIKGYHYLRRAIVLSVDNPEYLEAITKLLYPTIAKEYNTTPQRVERAIRHAIEVSFDRGDQDTLNEIFGFTVSYRKGKPTNSEFVAIITDDIRCGYMK